MHVQSCRLILVATILVATFGNRTPIFFRSTSSPCLSLGWQTLYSRLPHIELGFSGPAINRFRLWRVMFDCFVLLLFWFFRISEFYHVTSIQCFPLPHCGLYHEPSTTPASRLNVNLRHSNKDPLIKRTHKRTGPVNSFRYSIELWGNAPGSVFI